MKYSNYKSTIIFLFYSIDNGIITKGEIADWAGREILEQEDPPYFLIELSLSKSLDEQFVVLNDILPHNSDIYKELPFSNVVKQINRNYKKSGDTIETIRAIFNTTHDLNIEKKILKDIYILDNYSDMHKEGRLSLKTLDEFLNTFLAKFN